MRAWQPAELWAIKITPSTVQIPGDIVIEEGRREEFFCNRYRWRWMANLAQGSCMGPDGVLWLFVARDAAADGEVKQ